MGRKRDIEHRARRVEAKGPDWGDDFRKIERACDEMQADG